MRKILIALLMLMMTISLGLWYKENDGEVAKQDPYKGSDTNIGGGGDVEDKSLDYVAEQWKVDSWIR